MGGPSGLGGTLRSPPRGGGARGGRRGLGWLPEGPLGPCFGSGRGGGGSAGPPEGSGGAFWGLGAPFGAFLGSGGGSRGFYGPGGPFRVFLGGLGGVLWGGGAPLSPSGVPRIPGWNSLPGGFSEGEIWGILTFSSFFFFSRSSLEPPLPPPPPPPLPDSGAANSRISPQKKPSRGIPGGLWNTGGEGGTPATPLPLERGSAR